MNYRIFDNVAVLGMTAVQLVLVVCAVVVFVA